MNNFWEKLEKPIFALAPMANVTDAAYRRVIAKYGKPSVCWTEFVSADGLALAGTEGKRKLMLDLKYTEAERPIVAQFFTSSPEHMRAAAALAAELDFDGIDINMGCPDKSVEKQGAGANLMKNPEQARALIRAAKEGAPNLPVSVKTRIGYSRPDLENWLPEILKEEPAAVIIHARTRKEMSKVPARWEFVKEAVDIRNRAGSATLILGNGDVADLNEARIRVAETGCDGVMLGRAIFGNPWLFAEKGQTLSTDSQGLTLGSENIKEKLKVLIEHCQLFEELLGQDKNFAIMKKHFKAYVNGFDGAAELRGRLMETGNAKEVEEVIRHFSLSL
ncbi:MAG: tRNA-dihydrouridine synthase [Parcubacteria group bacterium GW2011_GWA2_50_10b]|nr:MAG: tRNA-dihydrouridine synthase [Parcubacteria group bacterium GW2011_GWA2_50_10b]